MAIDTSVDFADGLAARVLEAGEKIKLAREAVAAARRDYAGVTRDLAELVGRDIALYLKDHPEIPYEFKGAGVLAYQNLPEPLQQISVTIRLAAKEGHKPTRDDALEEFKREYSIDIAFVQAK